MSLKNSTNVFCEANNVAIQHKECKSILTPSKVAGINYTLSPYIGCLHNCLYCYVRFMGFARGRSWGKFVDIKINAPSLLKKQLNRIKPNQRIFIATASDPYQPPEERYKLTRQILKILQNCEVSVCILTKSTLVLRDIDILKDMVNVEVGFSIATVDDRVRQIFEPLSSSIDDRFSALNMLRKSGIKTWAFIAPILPVLTTANLTDFIKRLSECVEYVLIDKLNYFGKLPSGEYIKKEYPTAFLKCQKLTALDFHLEKFKIISECEKYQLAYKVCF